MISEFVFLILEIVYTTQSNQIDSEVLKVPEFIQSLHKSTKRLGFSFVCNTPKLWNVLPDDIHSATSLLSFRNTLKAYVFTKAYPPQDSSYFSTHPCGPDLPPVMSLD